MYAVHYVALVCLQITLQCEWHYTRHMCALVCLQTTLLWDIIHVLGRWKISTMCLLLSDLSHVNVWRVLIPSRVKVASSVNSINGSNWRLVCNQWQNSRRMALSPGCRFCTGCGWNGYKPSSCNVRHTRVRETPIRAESLRVLVVGLRCTISRMFSCSSMFCLRARSDETWALGSVPHSRNVLKSAYHVWLIIDMFPWPRRAHNNQGN